MKYEKPEISFQKFHTDAFLDNEEILSANDPETDPWSPFFSGAGFNGTISLSPDGVGGWFNG